MIEKEILQEYFILWQKRKVDFFIIFLGSVVGLYFQWTLPQISVFLIFLWSFLGPMHSSTLLFLAILSFLYMILSLLLGREFHAEEFAIYSYYFLGMILIRNYYEANHCFKMTEKI